MRNGVSPFRTGLLRVRAGGASALMAALVVGGLIWGGMSGPSPSAVAATAPKAYIGLYGSSSVAVLDTATGRVLRTIKVPAGPEAVIVTPNGRRVYVSGEDATELSVIDTATDTVIRTLDLGRSPQGMALSRDTKTLLVSMFDIGQLDVIDTATLKVVAQVPVGKPHGVALSPDGRTAYVGSQDRPNHNAIVVVDIPGRRVSARLPLDQTPRGLTLSPNGKSMYFTEANSAEVKVLDTATNKVTATITVGPIPHQIAFTPDHKYALAVVQATGQLAIIDAASHQIVKDVAVGKFPHWVALTSDGALAYVTNEGDNTASVVDMAKQQVVATILVGDGPRKIALQRGAGAMSEYLPPSTPQARQGFAARPPQPVAAGAGGVQIRMATFAFGPATVTVRAGQRVTWIDGDPVPHTATAKDGRWDSGQVVPGGSFTVTMTKPGTYEYFCGDHPFMQAKVIVTK
ncbi:MAG TPA: cytochrome D1 domain-containing protein [bacterium]|nr:cytochrome D1 domain-containing protein [bacterium]